MAAGFARWGKDYSSQFANVYPEESLAGLDLRRIQGEMVEIRQHGAIVAALGHEGRLGDIELKQVLVDLVYKAFYQWLQKGHLGRSKHRELKKTQCEEQVFFASRYH